MLKSLTTQDNIVTNVGEGSHIALTYGDKSIIVMQNTNTKTEENDI